MGALHNKTDYRCTLLIAACRRDVSAGVLARTDGVMQAIAMLDDTRHRADFLEFASRHGVMGLVAGVLLRSGVLAGRSSRADFETHLRALGRRAMIMQLERDNILRALETSGIRAVLLKGSGLVSIVYNAPVDRDYGDVDILVHESDINAAVQALAARGYDAPGSAAVNEGYLAHHFHVRVQRGATIVELHWALTLPRETYRLDPALFRRDAMIHAAIPDARVPRAEHALLHMVVENVRDAFTRLTRVVDLDRIIAATPTLDWDYLEQCARKAHLLPALSLALETSVRLLGTPVPQEILDRIRPTGAARLHLSLFDVPRSLLAQQGLSRPAWKLLLQLWLVTDRSRIQALARLFRGHDDEPLEWLWMGEDVPRTIQSSISKRWLKVSKLLVYQLGMYRKVVQG